LEGAGKKKEEEEEEEEEEEKGGRQVGCMRTLASWQWDEGGVGVMCYCHFPQHTRRNAPHSLPGHREPHIRCQTPNPPKTKIYPPSVLTFLSLSKSHLFPTTMIGK